MIFYLSIYIGIVERLQFSKCGKFSFSYFSRGHFRCLIPIYIEFSWWYTGCLKFEAHHWHDTKKSIFDFRFSFFNRKRLEPDNHYGKFKIQEIYSRWLRNNQLLSCPYVKLSMSFIQAGGVVLIFLLTQDMRSNKLIK